jgi:RNA polymerase-binding transcription factor
MIEGLDLHLVQDTLEKERAILLEDIRREKARLEVYNEENPDSFDLADQSRYQEISLNRLENLEKWLEQIESAHQRIQDGSYGICNQCGKPINPERLEAMPAAAYCLKCQKKQERKSY